MAAGKTAVLLKASEIQVETLRRLSGSHHRESLDGGEILAGVESNWQNGANRKQRSCGDRRGVVGDGKYVDIDALTSRRARSCISI
jgi:hypothetical protein